MQGPNIDDVDMQGIIPRMVRTVFNRIETASEIIEFTVKVSMIEIYMEKIKDLIDPTKDNLKIHEEKGKGVYMHDITETYIGGENEVYDLMKLGNSNRSISATLMNAESSRSHSIFILTVTQTNTEELSQKTGRLYLVDLAGSEKISKTGAAGQTLEEAKMINKSLTTLGKVITALTDKKSTHIPYRESKLTRILSESLGGNSKTALVITCSPHPFNESETISTLRFGTRARSIKNEAKVNREYTIPELKKLLEKAENEAAFNKKKVIALEKIIKDMGGELPKDEELSQIAEVVEEPEEIEEEKENDEEAQKVTSEELLAKDEEIEILKDQLQKEKDRLHEAQKLVADLKEEVAIQEIRIMQVTKDRDNLQSKAKDFILKFQ